MATVTKKFKDDFDTWTAHWIASEQWTQSEMDEFKDTLRRDLGPGADHLREGLTVIVAPGVEIPATIDNHEERYRLWADYFAAKAECIRAI